MTGRVAVHQLNVLTASRWAFQDGTARWYSGEHGHATEFDPFPAYPHSYALATKAAQFMERTCPPLWNVDVWLADREEVSRSNGHSHLAHGGHYEDGNWIQEPPSGHIVLSGKRIPPHPAMTHYLVAHEFGHHVHYMLNYLRDEKHLYDDELLREYLAVRGLPVQMHIHHGEGGTWHSSGHEVLANDFRILVGKVETDYWPHEGIPYPDSPALDEWWAAAMAALAEKRTEQ